MRKSKLPTPAPAAPAAPGIPPVMQNTMAVAPVVADRIRGLHQRIQGATTQLGSFDLQKHAIDAQMARLREQTARDSAEREELVMGAAREKGIDPMTHVYNPDTGEFLRRS